jgi:hypothetical protein
VLSRTAALEWGPTLEISTEIFSKSDIFSALKYHHPKTTTQPAVHHKFTTKNHLKTTHFLKKPLQNTPSTSARKN